MAAPLIQTDQIKKAALFGVGSGFCFSIMAGLVKFLSREVDPLNLVFFRSVIHFLIASAVVWFTGEKLPRRPQKVLVYRGAAGFVSLMCLFFTLSRLPIAVSMMLSWCSPIFVLGFSSLFLNEQTSKRAWVWVVGAFLGLVFLLDLLGVAGGRHPEIALFPVLVGLVGSALAASAYVAVRAASAKYGVNIITFYFSGVATLGSLFVVRFPLQVSTPQTWVLILLMGSVAGLAQYLMTQAYRFAKAGLVSMFTLSSAAFSALLGWALFGEFLGLSQWLGLIFMLGSIARLARVS